MPMPTQPLGDVKPIQRIQNCLNYFHYRRTNIYKSVLCVRSSLSVAIGTSLQLTCRIQWFPDSPVYVGKVKSVMSMNMYLHWRCWPW